MSLRIVFLGTGGSIPTSERSLPAILIQRQGEQIMFDCGEGAQRQIVRAKGGFHRKTSIFITHMHGDHILGLPGLMQTMALLGRERKLEIYGPPGIENFLKCITKTVKFTLSFAVETHEIRRTGVVCKEKEYSVHATWANHVIPSLAYALVEKPRPGVFFPDKATSLGIPKGYLWSELQQGREVRLPYGRVVKPEQVVGSPRAGRKVVYTGDTKPFKKLVEFSSDADLLIHDATLSDDLARRASRDGHSTPSQAAKNAKEAKVRQLILNHISARYDNPNKLLSQAKKVFKRTRVAEDFMEIEIPFRDS